MSASYVNKILEFGSLGRPKTRVIDFVIWHLCINKFYNSFINKNGSHDGMILVVKLEVER